jgi:hypothetical protein
MDSNASSDDSPHPSHGCSLQLELWELGVMGPHCTAKFHGSMDSLQSASYRGEVFTGAVSAADLPLHSTGNAHRQCRSGLAVPHKEPRRDPSFTALQINTEVHSRIAWTFARSGERRRCAMGCRRPAGRARTGAGGRACCLTGELEWIRQQLVRPRTSFSCAEAVNPRGRGLHGGGAWLPSMAPGSPNPGVDGISGLDGK